ncbi:hypothetical protein SAICODRAFT_207750 [Saitoella complicata NRRL Y-17804]|uniref:uncharacterized protein n=1 Tax=Saitoella complicata (strain BCRC 22490 / CBS 7301 / JCM 7358 / NBRC 10748 / NRRL Y-17804) TaxID=698492 RepID=UPI0008674B2C|nr:uncharacterized protein SAICODRAFT_207750 [Saitoella complicata NRRL Y-17804]ODQ54292.1 hypothetical protein SAICODRAFT_207750 [Saitoella complicata NRRL Y-17804]
MSLQPSFSCVCVVRCRRCYIQKVIGDTTKEERAPSICNFLKFWIYVIKTVETGCRCRTGSIRVFRHCQVTRWQNPRTIPGLETPSVRSDPMSKMTGFRKANVPASSSCHRRRSIRARRNNLIPNGPGWVRNTSAQCDPRE